jgi:flavin reductase
VTDPARPAVAEFREAASRFATGVVVVTCVGPDGLDHAMTVNAFTAVSLDPLLVLVCVERTNRFHQAMEEQPEWAVSVLGAEAEPVARWLATRGRPLVGQLERVPHRRSQPGGPALLNHALATLVCRTTAVHPAGDHDIVVGQVTAIDNPGTPPAPLLYHRRTYRLLQ